MTSFFRTQVERAKEAMQRARRSPGGAAADVVVVVFVVVVVVVFVFGAGGHVLLLRRGDSVPAHDEDPLHDSGSLQRAAAQEGQLQVRVSSRTSPCDCQGLHYTSPLALAQDISI